MERVSRPDTAAFDETAERYDALFTASALGRALRDRVWGRLEAVFAGRGLLLDLGCGTGEDAIHLARAGHRVVAIDVSTEMITVARRKAIAAGCADRIEFRVAPIESLDSLPGHLVFDGVFSNFGAINCVADLPRLAACLAHRLAPAAPLLFVIMGRHVPWEWAWYLARGDWRRAFRRLAPGGATWRGLTIRYPTPAELARALEPQFAVRARAALGFALPPSYASRWLEARPRTLAALDRIDRSLQHVTPWLADHYVLEAKRAGGSA